MEFENYLKRINSIKEIETNFDQLNQGKQNENRFSIKRNEMVLEETEKSKFAQEEKYKLIQMEQFSLEKITRISLYRTILQKTLTFYHLDSLKRIVEDNQNINFSQPTRRYLLNGIW